MPRYKRRKPRKTARDPSTALMTVDEFCDRNGISRSWFYTMLNNGDGPKTLRTGRRIMVSPEAETAWRRAHEK